MIKMDTDHGGDTKVSMLLYMIDGAIKYLSKSTQKPDFFHHSE